MTEKTELKQNMNLVIDRNVYIRLKTESAITGLSMSELANKFIKQGLNVKEDK